MSENLILVMGVTGQLGSLVAKSLKGKSLRVTSRRKSDLPKLKSDFGDSVFMGLDDPRTFSEICRVWLCY